MCGGLLVAWGVSSSIAVKLATAHPRDQPYLEKVRPGPWMLRAGLPMKMSGHADDDQQTR